MLMIILMRSFELLFLIQLGHQKRCITKKVYWNCQNFCLKDTIVSI